MHNKKVLKSRTRGDFPYFLDYRSRWNDNDVYGHLNNSIYNLMVDSVVNAWLIQVGGHDPFTSSQRGLVVRSEVNYFLSMAYPGVAELGLRVNKLGKSSVEYEVGIFEADQSEARAVAHLVHVFVDVETGKPSPEGLPSSLRNRLNAILLVHGDHENMSSESEFRRRANPTLHAFFREGHNLSRLAKVLSKIHAKVQSDLVSTMPARISKNSRRATHACLNCRHRKVRCDVSRSGPPCWNCRWDQVSCNVVPRSAARRLELMEGYEGQESYLKPGEDPQDTLGHQSNSIFTGSTFSIGLEASKDPGRSQAWRSVSPSSAWGVDESAVGLQECFRIPNTTILAEFLQGYFAHVHPMLPMLNEAKIWPLKHLGNSTSLADHGGGDLSLLLIQALLFASSTYVKQDTLDSLGFRNAREARASFYGKAKNLYHHSLKQDDLLMSQASLLLTYWCPAFSRGEEKPNTTWLKASIRHARSIGAEECLDVNHDTQSGPGDNTHQYPVSHRKRLWWCCIIRDRIMSLCVRRPLQIRQEDMDFSKIACLEQTELMEDSEVSQPSESSAKSHLFGITTLLCKLCIYVTRTLTVVYQEKVDVLPRSSISDAASIETAEEELRLWYDAAQLHLSSQPKKLAATSRSCRNMVMLQTNLLWVYYDSARLALYNHARCLSMRNVSSIRHARPTSPNSAYSKDNQELEKTMDHMVGCLDEILESPLSNALPSSLVGCTAFPLALHFCAMNARKKLNDGTPLLSWSSISSTRLHTLLQIIDVCQPIYDGVHWISRTIQYFMECTHFDDHAVENLDQQSHADLLTDESSMSDSSLSPILNDPSYYLRMALTIDISIREGRLPDEQDFPETVKALIYQTGCFMPQLFESENDGSAEEESYRYLRSLDWHLEPPILSSNENLEGFIEQDRSLFFAMEMGLGP